MGWNLYEIYSPSFRIVKTCFQTGTLGIGMIQSLWVKLGA